jgi:formate dehydrogenase major subunit
VKDGFAFQDGLFTGYDEQKREYDKSTWNYQMGDDGFVKADDTLQHPRCVWNLLKEHVKIYTPEFVSRICGTPTDKYLKVCEMIAATSAPNKAMTSMYALGWTQHSKGSQNIRAMAMLQLILGNIGIRGGGMNALRGHSNIQGLTDIGLMSNLLPGYLILATDKEPDFAAYIGKRGFKAERPNQMSYWQNYKKFFVSFQKAMFGQAATAENDWAYHYLPKLDVPGYDMLRAFELMHQGKMNGYICQGFNPLLSAPNRAKVTEGLSKLKYLVSIDPLQTETARFWEDHGEYNDVKPEEIQTTVFELPSTLFAEDEGSLTNSGRWLQWHWPGATPPGEAKSDIWIMAQLYKRLKALYRNEGGTFPDPILNLNWPYKDPDEPTPVEVAKASASCATTAQQRAATGFIPAASPRPATIWRGVILPTRIIRAPIPNGRSPGRQTAASCTIARRLTSRGRPGIRRVSSSSGMAPNGPATMCPISRQRPSRSWCSLSS